jgi:hypothetical protein
MSCERGGDVCAHAGARGASVHLNGRVLRDQWQKAWTLPLLAATSGGEDEA